jgi:hypothetical protein
LQQAASRSTPPAVPGPDPEVESSVPASNIIPQRQEYQKAADDIFTST